jgi:transcriptional regulator with XRE-family HTH domain
MLDSLILSASALLNLNSPVFHEEVVELPGGEVEITADFEWNAVTFGTVDGSPVPKVWYERDGEMLPWHQAEDTNGQAEADQLDLLFAGNPRQSLVIASEEPVKLVGHFFNTRVAHAGENEVAFDPFDPDTKRFTTTIEIPSFIDRSQWGADESIRLWKITRGIRQFFRHVAPEARKLSVDLRPRIISREDSQGRRLTWPIEQNQAIKKFIVHHTGEVVDEAREPRELMRAIYYYHTITRGWGDIGYNYVIDQKGNIYEGRAGGIATVGAHTAYYNTGTIGMALMGNFNVEEPTEAQLKVLTLLIADHSVRFDVNPVAKSNWLGTYSDNIAGHKDVAQPGHGTACPGVNLHNKLPGIRLEAKRLAESLRKHKGLTTRDFLRKSNAAPQVRGRIERDNTNYDAAALAHVVKTQTLQRGDRSSLELRLKNNTDLTWLKGEKLGVTRKPDGVLATDFVLTENVRPGKTGVFRARIMVKNTPNGEYELGVRPKITTLGKNDQVNAINYPIQVSGDRSNLTKSVAEIKEAQKAKSSGPTIAQSLKASTFRESYQPVRRTIDYGPDVKIKLSYFKENFALITGDKTVEIWSQNRKYAEVSAYDEIRIRPLTHRGFEVEYRGKKHELLNPQFKTNGVITINNYDRGLGSIAYNQFRKQLNFFHSGDAKFYIVNQLPLEQYIWGLAEQPSTEPDQKKHAIHILARSYAYVYAGTRRKFKTNNYDLEDSPATSQLYLGYDWERHRQEQKELVEDTWGMVITVDDRPVIGPYFTQSDGTSEDKWVSQYPWAPGRELPYDKGLEARGHEVGLSGNSARVLAEKGKNYREILDYFYEGIDIKKLY